MASSRRMSRVGESLSRRSTRRFNGAAMPASRGLGDRDVFLMVVDGFNGGREAAGADSSSIHACIRFSSCLQWGRVAVAAESIVRALTNVGRGNLPCCHDAIVLVSMVASIRHPGPASCNRVATLASRRVSPQSTSTRVGFGLSVNAAAMSSLRRGLKARFSMPP